MTAATGSFRHLYPFASCALDFDGLRYHYVDEGAGDPIVCVHGNPSWSLYYRNVIRAFAPTHRVLAVDHIGCGLSDKPGDDRYSYRLGRRADDLERFLDALGLSQNVTLVVHDWGGMIGSAVALRNPRRIARMVVLNTAAFLLPRGKRLPIRLWLIRNLAGLGAVLVRGCNAFALGATYMAVKQPMPRDVRRAYLAPYDSWKNRIATLRFVQDIPLSRRHPSYATARWVDEHLNQLGGIPKLICWGAGDFVFDDHFLEEWRRRCPEAEIVRFPHAGHYVLEDAGEEVIERMRAFFKRHPVPAASAPQDSEVIR